MTEAPEFYDVDKEAGTLSFNIHIGQQAILEAPERFVLALCGSQAGKTVSGPLWLWNEICKKGPGEYAVVAPTFALMELKCIPEFKRLFQEILEVGEYKQNPVRRFEFSKAGIEKAFGPGKVGKPCTVRFCYAEDPDTLESMTLKGAWCDEAGQKKFKLDAWDALMRRLRVHRGRVFITTTPYEFNWLKKRISDRAGKVTTFSPNEGRMVTEEKRGPEVDNDIHLVQFESILNPAFSLDEFEKARKELPDWKFKMMYRGIWTRPGGTIYDCFDEKINVCKRFRIPDEWPRVVGIDFGQNNTAAAFFAIDPRGKPGEEDIYLYRTYHAGGKTAEEHVHSLLRKAPSVPVAVGGAPSEDEWRNQFSRAGLPVLRPVIDGVEPGIDLVYKAFKTGRLKVFDDLTLLIKDIYSYSWELDNDGEPVQGKIENKHAYHRLDGVRYGITEILQSGMLGDQVINSLN